MIDSVESIQGGRQVYSCLDTSVGQYILYRQVVSIGLTPKTFAVYFSLYPSPSHCKERERVRFQITEETLLKLYQSSISAMYELLIRNFRKPQGKIAKSESEKIFRNFLSLSLSLSLSLNHFPFARYGEGVCFRNVCNTHTDSRQCGTNVEPVWAEVRAKSLTKNLMCFLHSKFELGTRILSLQPCTSNFSF